MTDNFKSNHIAEELWISIEKNAISDDDFLDVLEHTQKCTQCAERLAYSMEQSDDMGIMPPEYLKEEIKERILELEVDADEYQKHSSNQKKLLFYSFKVGFVVAASVCILVLTGRFQNIQVNAAVCPLEMEKRENIIDKINTSLNYATDKINWVSNQLLFGGKEYD